MRERKLNITKRLRKPRFALIYAVILFVATIALTWIVLHNLWLSPRMATGVPILGYRMEGIPELDDSWLAATTEFGRTQTNVEDVKIFWTTGPVVYFEVRLNEGTSRRDGRAVATRIVEHFIDLSDEAALYYNLQVVISVGDIAVRRAENQEAVTAHVHEYNWSLAEAILAHAERYPSSANVNRARDNINVFANSITLAAGEAELASMRSRYEAITAWTAEEEAARVEEDGLIPGYSGFRQVPPSEISRFPNWGVWSNRRSRIRWN